MRTDGACSRVTRTCSRTISAGRTTGSSVWSSCGFRCWGTSIFKPTKPLTPFKERKGLTVMDRNSLPSTRGEEQPSPERRLPGYAPARHAGDDRNPPQPREIESKNRRSEERGGGNERRKGPR